MNSVQGKYVYEGVSVPTTRVRVPLLYLLFICASALAIGSGCGVGPHGLSRTATTTTITSTTLPPETVAPRAAEKPVPDQGGPSPEGLTDSPRLEAKLSEMVSTSDVVFTGTLVESRPAFLVDREHPSLKSLVYTDLTVDVDTYYRNKLSGGRILRVTILGGQARMPEVLLELRRQKAVRNGTLDPDDAGPSEWEDEIFDPVSQWMAPAPPFQEDKRYLVFANRSDCTVVRSGLPERQVRCVRAAYDRYGIMELLPRRSGHWQTFGWLQVTSEDLPAAVYQWPKTK